MNRFYGSIAKKITPYVPGEQPLDRCYVKLNTNESPYPPSPLVVKMLRMWDSGKLKLYPDPKATALRQKMANAYDLDINQVFAGNGSDEVLAFAFMAFFDRGDKVYFPNITYGFYKVYAELFGLDAVEIPLKKDFSIKISDYHNLDGNIFIANPNAPTGLCLSREEIEGIVSSNKDGLVVVDEAYIDFAENQTAIPLIEKYDNLLVVQTFSKSRALAGMRLGFGFGSQPLMEGLERMKYSFNPYNVNRIAQDVGVAAIEDTAYFDDIIRNIKTARSWAYCELVRLGFKAVPSSSNFIFAEHNRISGEELAKKLREEGILIRHFGQSTIKNHVRITVGTMKEMEILLVAVKKILGGEE